MATCRKLELEHFILKIDLNYISLKVLSFLLEKGNFGLLNSFSSNWAASVISLHPQRMFAVIHTNVYFILEYHIS